MVRSGSSDQPGGARGDRPGGSGTGRKRKWVPEPHSAEDRDQRRYPWDEDEGYQRGPTRPVRPTPPPRRERTAHGLYPPPGTHTESDFYTEDDYPTRPNGENGKRRERPEPEPEPRQARRESEGGSTGPRKITVTRVAAWRSKQLTQNAVHAFRRAAHADGADKSGLAALTYAVMLNYATDATVAVALANTLFFSAATAESKSKVALYLLITVAPFAVIAPVIGPMLDRLQHGRRMALAASFAGQALLAVVMALHFNDWLLYPAALGSMVLSKSFNVLKAAVTPRVLPSEITLVKTNSRLTVFGLAAGGVFGAVAAGFAKLFDSPGALWFTAVVCLAGAVLCLRIPSWVEVTEGEVPAALRESTALPKRRTMGRAVNVALWGNGTIRVLTGFLTLFAAFVIKSETEHDPFQQILLLGMVGAAAGLGNFAGNAVGARLYFGKPAQVILGCMAGTLAATVLAAVAQGIGTVVVLGLVGSTGSALAKVCLDAVIQRDLPEESRASAFGRSETILQIGWVFGGALGVLLPPTYWIGFTVLSGLLALGLTQTALVGKGSSLIPPLGGRRAAARPVAEPVASRPQDHTT